MEQEKINIEIDNLLNQIFENGLAPDHDVIPPLQEKARIQSKSKGYIKKTPGGSLELTPKGNDVIKAGGVVMYEKKLDQKEQNDEKIQNMTITQFKYSFFQVKNWFLILLLGSFLSALFGFIFNNIFEILIWIEKLLSEGDK